MIEALLSRLPQSSMKLGLERITAACDALGGPQGRYPSVLVAGTNGKGSTCAFLASVLAKTGKRVGLYTSPHLVSFRERIRIDGAPISREELERSGERLLRAWPSLGQTGHPDALSYFEAATALAFDAFAHAGVELAVLEVGLGGRLDATNVPGTRLCATVVTRIGIDHAEYLGTSLAAIAAEKGAIARAGVPLVIAAQPPEAREALRLCAEKAGAPLIEVGRDAEMIVSGGAPASPMTEAGEGAAPSTEVLEYRGPRWTVPDLRLGLLGTHQIQNAAVAVATLEAAQQTLGAEPTMVREGLVEARWPGRLEAVATHPLVLLDGAHNPDGAEALAASLKSLWPGMRPQLVFGVLSDKDRRAILEAIVPLAAEVHLCPLPSDRAVPVEAVASEATALGGTVHVHASVEAALDAARASAGAEGAVLVCGSLYLVGAARGILASDEN